MPRAQRASRYHCIVRAIRPIAYIKQLHVNMDPATKQYEPEIIMMGAWRPLRLVELEVKLLRKSRINSCYRRLHSSYIHGVLKRREGIGADGRRIRSLEGGMCCSPKFARVWSNREPPLGEPNISGLGERKQIPQGRSLELNWYSHQVLAHEGYMAYANLRKGAFVRFLTL